MRHVERGGEFAVDQARKVPKTQVRARERLYAKQHHMR